MQPWNKKNKCIIMLFPSLPSRGTFARRLEDDINNHSMPFKAKFYL